VIGATIRKDVWLLLRDRGRLLMLFAMPVIFIAVFGSMFSGGGNRSRPRPIAHWHATGDTRGENIEKALDGSAGFVADPRPSADAVRAAVASGDVVAGLIVPAQPGMVELSIDQGQPVQVIGPVQGTLTGIVARATAYAPVAALPPMIEVKTPPGVAKPLDDISGFQVSVPGNAVLFAFFLAMTVAMSFASERTTGTWRRLLASPVPRWKALIGKMIPYYLVGCCQLGLLFGIGIGVFGMKVAGSPFALVVLSAMVVLCATSFGLLVAAFGWTEKQIGSITPVMLLVMGLIGGCMFPRLFMPPFMQQLGKIVPHAWALDGYYDVLIRQGTSLADVMPSVGALAVFSALFAGIGVWRFRFE
jgi:ABC-type transport system involved in multi-copper enzyme maturation permease subunit